MRVVNSGRPGGGGRPRVKTGKRRFDSARPRQQAGHDLPLIPPEDSRRGIGADGSRKDGTLPCTV